MDSTSFSGLLNNAAIMLALGIIYDALGLDAIRDKRKREVVSGILIGILGVAIMYTPWQLMPGVFFDTRWVLISLSALFFGFTPTLIAVIMTVSYRVYEGGTGAFVGSMVIIVPALIGLAWRAMSTRYHQPLDIARLYLFGVVIQLSVLACFLLLPEPVRSRTIAAVGPPMMLIFPVGTMLLGLVLRRQNDRRQADRELQSNRKQLDHERSLLRGLIDALPDLIYFKDTRGRFLGCNHAFERYIGCVESDLLNKTDEDLAGVINQDFKHLAQPDLSDENDKTRYEHEASYPDGTPVVFNNVKARFYGQNGELHGTVGISHDISKLKEAEEKIRTLALYDPLTRLPNRRLMLERLKMLLASSQRSGLYNALLFIDLDNFKDINDTQGHSLGDQLLVAVAERLQGSLRMEDTAARLGGDEFVVLIGEISGDKTTAARRAEEVAEKLRAALCAGYELAYEENQRNLYYCTASIGITLFSNIEKDEEEVLKQGDLAMYQSKARGRNMICFFDPVMQAARDENVALQAALRNALANGELELFYQAQVDSAAHITGAEVLLRWHHPQRGMVSPDSFIPLAEESGLILAIGDWVLRSACQQLKQWQSEPQMRDLHISVNVSARQFRRPDFAEDVRRIIDSTGIDPSRLKLELTESLVLDDLKQAIDKMLQLRELGVHFAMDDFGTGQSSLSNLKRLPLEQLKIDRSFVRDLTFDPDDALIIQAIINLSRSLNLDTIAEGVETEEQCHFLFDNGCYQYQGYLFSKPVPLHEFTALAASEAAIFKPEGNRQ